FENRVFAVPECDGEAKPALTVTDAQQPVFAPAVGPAAGVVVRKITPAVAPLGVVFAHRPPLALGQVRPPPLPVFFPSGVLREPLRLRGPSLRHVCPVLQDGGSITISF